MASIISNVLNPWTASKIPSLAGKCAVITGANEGIGAAFTTELLRNDIAKVIILGNDPARHPEAKAYWNKETGTDVSQRVVFHEVDLGDYKAVRQVAEKIKKETDRIDILDCDAAIGMYKTDVPTNTNDKSHAIDRHFACNNVGHAVLTEALLPLIKKTASQTGDVRFVMMASNLHFAAPPSVKFESIDELNTDLGPTLQYNRSKLANVLYTKKLARMFEAEGLKDKIFANCIHPGVVKTAQQDGVLETYGEMIKSTVGDGIVGQAAEKALTGANYVARTVAMKDSPAGALSALFAATSPEVKTSGITGEYIVPNGHVQEADKRALDTDMQDRCYNLIQLCIKEGYGNAEGADHQKSSEVRGSASI